MPVAYTEDKETAELGTAGFLKIEAEDGGYRGAFFVINALGEPMEFTYTRIAIDRSFLWRKADIARHAARKIAGSLFTLCPESPRLVFCLTAEIDLETFSRDIKLAVPLGGVTLSKPPGNVTESENDEKQGGPESIELTWYPGWPSDGSPEYNLFKRLLSSGLILEPFERAATGLREVYK